ncbi:unnamed protein product [Didymodactylos carnosus]|nr:unnamed protein product [Didymodactylos carnosus]CAF4133171.1 unnamed protein product [Didymodactylos carnosus]
MMMGKHAKISIYEGRWFVNEEGVLGWQGVQQGKIRRDQVVTLQDHVINQMPMYVQKGLFENINECVWQTSRNIPIREVEDRLFALIQPFVKVEQVELIPENLHEQSECLVKGSFDVLIGADGANSFVRRYCNITMISEGLEYACGVAYDIPDQVAECDAPLHQALNCILTISQTRYLVNSSTSRRGYLNIRLIQSEYDELTECLQVFQTKNESLDLLDYSKCPNSPVWSIVRQGLDFFKIHSKYVVRVAPIQINVRHSSIVIRELRFQQENKTWKTALAFLAGDAAMNVHFWPGRGMNSGMKAAMSLARNILRSCTSKTKEQIEVRTPLRFLDFLDYEGFMARLRAREQQGRSLRVLVNPIDDSIEEAYKYGHLSYCYVRYTNKLMKKLKETRQRLEERPEWPHKNRQVLDDELQLAANRISSNAVAQLSLANPWPTREMAGVEVLVEDTFPLNQQQFLPVPSITKHIRRTPSILIKPRLVTLWITGFGNDMNHKHIIETIQGSKQFSTIQHELHIVKTIDEAKAWSNGKKTSLLRQDVVFKVITVWRLENNMIGEQEPQTAVDVIRAVRSDTPHVPVLIYTTKKEEIQPALEFPNVMATDSENDVYEFVGLALDTQWNTGCNVKDSKSNYPSTIHQPRKEFLRRTHSISNS